MNFYRDDSGDYKLDVCRPDDANGYITEKIDVDNITIEEGLDGKKELVILDNPSYGRSYRYGLSEDMKSIILNYDKKTIYQRS